MKLKTKRRCTTPSPHVAAHVFFFYRFSSVMSSSYFLELLVFISPQRIILVTLTWCGGGSGEPGPVARSVCSVRTGTQGPSDSPRGASVAHVDDVVEVVAHGDEQVEEQLAAAGFHLSLHGAAALECLAAADDQGEVMGAQAAVRVWGVGVGVLGGAQDGCDVDAGLQPLLAKGEALELIEAVAVRGAVDDGIAEDVGAYAGKVDGGVGRGGVGGACGAATSGFGRVGGVVGGEVLGCVVLELPRVAVPVVDKARVVVTLVEVLEDGGEDLGFFVGEGDPPALRIKVAAAAGVVEEGRLAQDVFVRCKEATVGADGEGDDGRRRSVGDGGRDGRWDGGS